jgi:hypothetical protein
MLANNVEFARDSVSFPGGSDPTNFVVGGHTIRFAQVSGDVVAQTSYSGTVSSGAGNSDRRNVGVNKITVEGAYSLQLRVYWNDTEGWLTVPLNASNWEGSIFTDSPRSTTVGSIGTAFLIITWTNGETVEIPVEHFHASGMGNHSANNFKAEGEFRFPRFDIRKTATGVEKNR